MLINKTDLNKEIYVIAEAGNNHEGDFARAVELVDAAAESGAHAVKFQSIIAEDLVASTEVERIQQLKNFQLSVTQYSDLSKRAEQKSIDFLSTPFSLDMVDELNALVPAFKIASGDLTWHTLINRVAETGKPVILSTGGASIEEIRAAVSTFEKHRPNPDCEIAILQSTLAYPAPAEALNLNVLTRYRAEFNVVGYSDHYLGTNSCLAAAALGAQIIEKHFTLDKSTSEFRDHQHSADPNEMKQLVEDIHEVRSMLGEYEKNIQFCEREGRYNSRRSPKARRTLSPGDLLSDEDYVLLRPNSGLPASTPIVGETITKMILKDEDISFGKT